MSPKQPHPTQPPDPLPDLAAHQRWLLAAIQRPHRDPASDLSTDDPALAHAPAPVEAVVLPSATLTPAQRLAIYSDMYLARLLDVLRADFPGLRAMLDKDTFNALMRRLLTRHPPSRYTLFALGDPLPDDLTHSAYDDLLTDAPSQRPALHAMATLERAVHRCYHAPDAPPLDLSHLSTLTDADWDAATFDMAPGLCTLALSHDAHSALSAVRAQQPLPAAAWHPHPTFTVVWRRGVTVWRRPLTAPQYATLTALSRGLPLPDALDAAAAHWPHDPDALSDHVGAWFSEWAQDEMFSRVHTPPP